MFNKLIKRLIKRFKQELKNIYLSKLRKFVNLSSYPYISGDTFRQLSDHIYDERKNIEILKIKDGDIIFVKTDYLEQFVSKYLDKIDKKISLIFHNSDFSFEEKHIKHFKNENLLVFSQNLNIDFTKTNNIFPIPIGLENRSYFMNGKLKNFDRALKKSSHEFKNKLILCGFNPNTNNERKKILEIISKNENINFLRYSNHVKYLDTISEHKFNLCPEGNGLDTHRFWETLMMGSIPVVKKNNLVLNFEKFDIPILILDDWGDLDNLSKESLNKFYKNNYMKLKNNKYIYFDYWKKLIKDKLLSL